MVWRVVFGGEPEKAVAEAFATTVKTVRKWVERYETEGLAGLVDRPKRLRDPTPAERVEQIIALRRAHFSGKAIAKEIGVSRTTVSRILRAARLSRAKDLQPAEPVMRYEREHPGELIHLDIKKLGRFETQGHRVTGDRQAGRSYRVGWECVHVCIDDASRVAFSQIHPDETQHSAVPFLRAAVAYYASLGVGVSRVMTDNGACYKSHAFRAACAELGLKHIRTRPYTPKTNGKAERFIQTALREWAYAHAYPSSDDRAAQLPAWLHRYNWHRPHGGLNSATPISRLALEPDNLSRLHS
jgi:transposase InsO family protein